MRRGLERLLIIPDCHHPYVDVDAWRTALDVGRDFYPHRVVVLGDFGDYYCVSRHHRNPNRNRKLEVEVAAQNKGLTQLERLGADQYHFIQGNHEESLERYLMEHAPELFNIVTCRKLLELDVRGWTYTPFRKMLKIGKVNYTHCIESAGPRAHELAEADVQSNVVIGHTHRAAMTYSGNMQGARHVAIMGGWLGDVEMAKYLHDGKKSRHWQHAVTVGYMEPDGTTHFQLVPIMGKRACLNGKMVRSR